MPFRNPFFFSKRAIGRIDKIREMQEKEAAEGPSAPATVNNSKTIGRTTVGQSKNVHTTPNKKRAPENKPNVAKSLNDYPGKVGKPRDVEELIPAVNGKAAPHLVGKTPLSDGQEFIPEVKKVQSKAPRKKK